MHKVIDGYDRLGVQECDLECLKGYSSNDVDDINLEPRDGSKNTRSQLKRSSQELSVALSDVKRLKKNDSKKNTKIKKLENKNQQLASIVSEVRNSHSLFNSRQISQSPIVRQLREEISLHIVISNEKRDFKLEE